VIRCYITDRHTLRPGETLEQAIARNLIAGVDLIQIREKDLSGRELFQLVRAALALPNPHGTRVVVNTRADVALAAGAAGVHLPAGSAMPKLPGSEAEASRGLKPALRGGFLMGVSCHTVDEVRAAEAEGAGYVVFGPIFRPISKGSGLGARGLGQLAEAARAVGIPVLALGGVTSETAAACAAAGAAGVAGISLFQNC
jgi:thiamine-phosphate pyrophosphorylase